MDSSTTSSSGRLFFAGLLMLAAALLAALILGAAPQKAEAQSQQERVRVFAVTGLDRLISFSSVNPRRVITSANITGLQEGETIVGMDFRSANQRLYAVTNQSRVYIIRLDTGAAIQINETPFTPAVDGTSFGVDFNPTVDLIRLVSDTGQNLRISPVTGQVTDEDPDLAYADGDENEGEDPNVVSAAYSNPVNPENGTTLLDIDSDLDIVASQNPANDGTLNTGFSLGVNTSDFVGFDFSASNRLYASLKLEEARKTGFYTVSPNGTVTPRTLIGGRAVQTVKDIAVVLPTSAQPTPSE